jgi:intracellular septation protein A
MGSASVISLTLVSSKMITMMKRLSALVRYVAMEFGALIVFWIALYFFGIKPAIAATIAFILLDALYRWRARKPVTRIYVLTSTLAVAFGAIDLYAADPFMIKYEAVITNTVTGIFFVLGARGEKSIIQEMAERRQQFPDRLDVRYFFRLFTLFWAGYFFIKAAVYLWLGMTLPLERALALRVLIGNVSLAAMMALSFLGGRHLFFLCRWLGLLPRVELTEATAGSHPGAG